MSCDPDFNEFKISNHKDTVLVTSWQHPDWGRQKLIIPGTVEETRKIALQYTEFPDHLAGMEIHVTQDWLKNLPDFDI